MKCVLDVGNMVVNVYLMGDSEGENTRFMLNG